MTDVDTSDKAIVETLAALARDHYKAGQYDVATRLWIAADRLRPRPPASSAYSHVEFENGAMLYLPASATPEDFADLIAILEVRKRGFPEGTEVSRVVPPTEGHPK